MAYLDPPSNPGTKPQRLGATNFKTSTSDKLQTFRTIFGISCKFLTKDYLHEITLLFCFEGKSHAREITESFRKIRRRINDLRENVLYGYIQPSNLSSALMSSNNTFFGVRQLLRSEILLEEQTAVEFLKILFMQR
jgi:hypothetical protein